MDSFRSKVRQALRKFHGRLDSQKQTFTDSQQKTLRRLIGSYGSTLRSLNSIIDAIADRKKAANLFLSCLDEVGLGCDLGEFRNQCLTQWDVETELATGAKLSSLEVFVSHRPEDAAVAKAIAHELRRRGCEVFLSSDSQIGEGHDMNELRASIERADCVLVLLSPEMIIGGVNWTSRCVALATHLQAVRQRRILKNVYPFVVGLAQTEFPEVGQAWNLPLHDFIHGTALQQQHDFHAAGIFAFHPKRPGEFIDSLFKQFTYEICHIRSRADLETHEVVFNGAMEIYEDLIQDENERDPADSIKKWIRSNDGSPLASRRDERANWLDWVAVLHRGSKAHGALWSNTDRRTGICEVTFWGMESGFRSENLARQLVDNTLPEIAAYLDNEPGSKPLRAIAFTVEPVELSIFDTIADRAFARLEANSVESLTGCSRCQQLKALKSKIDPVSRKSFLLSEVESFVEIPANAASFAEQVRRFRRLFLYVHSSGGSERLREAGWEMRAFVVSQDDRTESDSEFAIYMQPPIIEPDGKDKISDKRRCPFYLFALVKPSNGGWTAEEALNWEYEHFLGDQFRAGKETALPGWDDYMVGFKKRFAPKFIATAKLKKPRLGPRYESAEAIVALVKSMQRKSAVLARLDITL